MVVQAVAKAFPLLWPLAK